MKHVAAITIVGVLLAGGAVSGEKGGKAKKRKDTAHVVATRDSRVSVHVAFGTRELEIIRTHYAPRYRRLPPGLAKKYARTGQLPPGWQKKMEPLPAAVERELVVLPTGYRRGVFEGHAVIYNPGGTIVDVAVLF